ncbi:MAG: TRAP transporter small permease [Oscillospiraceae bacterium]|nr:TRAP transporter small permease [Oscillospiraceae bacterium]
METIKNIKSLMNKVTWIISLVAYGGFIALTAIIVADVFLRFIFNNPIVGSYEIVQYVLMMAVFASFAYCQSLRGHIHVTMFIMLMPRKLKFSLYSITGLLSAGMAGLTGYAAALQAIMAKDSGYLTQILRIELYPFMWVECFGMATFAVVLLFDAICSGFAVFSKEFADEIQAEWG